MCHFSCLKTLLIIETQFEQALAKGEPCRTGCVQRQTRTRVGGEPRKATVIFFTLLFTPPPPYILECDCLQCPHSQFQPCFLLPLWKYCVEEYQWAQLGASGQLLVTEAKMVFYLLRWCDCADGVQGWASLKERWVCRNGAGGYCWTAKI